MTEPNSGLSAPEAYVLLSLLKIDLRKAMKIGFIGLLAQGILRMETEERAGLIRTRHIAHLKVADGVPEALLSRAMRGQDGGFVFTDGDNFSGGGSGFANCSGC